MPSVITGYYSLYCSSTDRPPQPLTLLLTTAHKLEVMIELLLSLSKYWLSQYWRYLLLALLLLCSLGLWLPWRMPVVRAQTASATSQLQTQAHIDIDPTQNPTQPAPFNLPSLPRDATPAQTSQNPLNAMAQVWAAGDKVPLLQYYQRYYQALQADDSEALIALFAENALQDSYLEYLIAYKLAHDSHLTAAERVDYYQKVFALEYADPLDRSGKQNLSYDYATVLEQAGNNELAITYYREALPQAEAQTALIRLAANKFRLSNYYLQARMYQEALDALDGEMVPSITAPSQRHLGNHQEALAAYEAWLQEQPNNISANFGKAWSLYYLQRNEEADAIFAQYPNDSEALYARALIASRADDDEQAILFFRQSGRGYDMWRSAEFLENNQRYEEALETYLALAAGTSSYADDAAYRAVTLGQTLGEHDSVEHARAQLPRLSYFRILLGDSFTLTLDDDVQASSPKVLELADALQQAGKREAALGELRFAMRDAYAMRDEAALLAIGEKLQEFEDFRSSQRFAERLVQAGSSSRAIWQLAYPLAYEAQVRQQAQRVNIPPQLIWAIMFQESRFYPRAISRSNAKGLMQFIPSTWLWMAELMQESPGDPFNPNDSIRYGATYLAWLVNYFSAYGGSYDLVVPSYNGGQGYIKRLFEGSNVNTDFAEYYHRIDKKETREYLERVMRAYHIYEQLYDF